MAGQDGKEASTGGTTWAYLDVLRALSEAHTFGMEPSLDGIRALCSAFGNPQDRYACIQVAGTNGKSSTARMVAALLHAEGFHVGLYTSPELVEYPERMEVDGQVVSHEEFALHVGRAFSEARMQTLGRPRGVLHDGTPAPASGDFTEFELLTAAAFSLFEAEKVDFAVLEVGLGGRWDATSVVHPSVATITGIGLDHMKILGNTVEAIAAEKAAIIEPASAVVLGPGTSDVADVFCDRADECSTHVRAITADDAPEGLFPRVPGGLRGSFVVEGVYPELMLSVQGCHGTYAHIALAQPAYQAQNVATAVLTAEAALGRALDACHVREALAGVALPGRFETLRDDPLLIIDAAHNPQSAHVLAQAIRDRFQLAGAVPGQSVKHTEVSAFMNLDVSQKPTLLLAVLADKDARGILRELIPVVSSIVVTQTASDRAIPVEELALIVEEMTGVTPRAFDMPSQAIEALERKGENTVAAGSITLAGEVKAAFSEDADE